MAIDRRTYTKADWDALESKLEHLDKEVRCPRCGNIISYQEVGNSISIKCETDGCIFGGIRGL